MVKLLSGSTSFARVHAKLEAAVRDPQHPNMCDWLWQCGGDCCRLPISFETLTELRAVRSRNDLLLN